MAPQSPRQKEKTDETYRRLLDAAKRVFAAKGYEGAAVQDITKAAGYSKGMFYRHWPSKEDAFFALIEEGISRQRAHLEEVYSNGISTPELILTGTRAMAADTADNWTKLFLELWTLSTRNETIRLRMLGLYSDWIDLLERMYVRLQSEKRVSEEYNPRMLASASIALLDGFNVQRTLGLTHLHSQDIGELLRRVLGM